MKTSPIEYVQTEQLESEFIPPLDERDAWGSPWEQQLSAVLAWQEAGGNSDGEAGQWTEPTVETVVPALEHGGTTSRYGHSGGSGAGSTPLTMRTIVRMNTLLVSLRERLLQVTTEASNIAIAEMALRQDPSAYVQSGTDASPALPRLHDENAQRIVELAESWFEIVAAAQVSMTTLTGVRASEASSGERRATAGKAYSGGERRRHAASISFPDRRMAG